MSFEPGLEPAADRLDPAYLFAFQENRLLVRFEEQGVEVPLIEELPRLGLDPIHRRFLGTLDGRGCFCAELEAGHRLPPGLGLEPLRGLWASLDEQLFWIAGRAFQIVDWERNSRFCGRCGAPTSDKPEERAKVCPACGSVHYPRICPAIIVAITRADTILLARARRFPQALYSVIAGFVDPGESLEECVHREVQEEVGIKIKKLRYFGSQSWPFPNSLMVAFTAEHAAGEICIDRKELVDAGWYRADRLPRIPDRLSIARRLIDWFLDRHSNNRGEQQS